MKIKEVIFDRESHHEPHYFDKGVHAYIFFIGSIITLLIIHKTKEFPIISIFLMIMSKSLEEMLTHLFIPIVE